MDSNMIRDKIINSAIEAACNCEGHKDGSVAAGFLGLAISNAIDNALLTAEPEPCEDARKVAAQVSAVFGVSRLQVSGDPGNDPALDRATEAIAAYASHVAGKRAEELRAQVETLREACENSLAVIMVDHPESSEAIETLMEALAATEPKSSTLHDKTPPRPRIVCLCGSTRFIELFATLSWTLERDLGVIVLGLHLLPASYAGADAAPDHMAEAAGKKEHFDELHKRKIDISDEILVLNVGGYIGESTRSEIDYAEAHGKPVRYLEDAALAATEPKP